MSIFYLVSLVEETGLKLAFSETLKTGFLTSRPKSCCRVLQVKIEALNDSRQIGMCLYNVVVLSAVGLTFTLLLEEKVVMIYGIVSACVILGTTLTQTIVFIPKVCESHHKCTAKLHSLMWTRNH